MSENTSKNTRFIKDQRLRDICLIGYLKAFYNRPSHEKKYLWTLLLAYPLVILKDGPVYGGPGQKSPDYRASDAEGTLKSRIKIAHTR
jgi:hypothetical protein